MRISEVKATDEKLIELMLEDSIGRNKDLAYFADILFGIEGNAAIALDSPWGSGKTFFVKQLKILFSALSESAKGLSNDNRKAIRALWNKEHPGIKELPGSQSVIYYDAWQNDNDNDPVLSLVYSIIQTEATEKDLTRYGIVFSKAVAVLDEISGKRISGLAEVLKGKDALKNLKEAKETQTLVKEFLDTFFPRPKDRMVIIIDELDRCNPDYAVKVLERIKHYFDDERITFVFSTNLYQLEHTIRRHYGEGFDAGRYLDRFFDLRLSLPQVDMNKYCREHGMDDEQYAYERVCRDVAKYLNMQMREANRFIQLAKTVQYRNVSGDMGDLRKSVAWGLDFCIGHIFPLMLALKLTDTSTYIRFISGENSKPLIELAEQWSVIMLTWLLERGETFEEATDGKRVTLENKLEKVYQGVFVKKYTDYNYQTTVGELEFRATTKDTLINLVNGLSKWSSYDK